MSKTKPLVLAAMLLIVASAKSKDKDNDFETGSSYNKVEDSTTVHARFWLRTSNVQDSLDFRPVGGPAYQPFLMTSRKQLLEVFDKNVAEARAAIAGASDEEFMKTWTLLSGGKQILAMPKIAVLRSFAINHVIHHRGQLSVYLRMNNVPVPSIYGPSGDEGQM